MDDQEMLKIIIDETVISKLITLQHKHSLSKKSYLHIRRDYQPVEIVNYSELRKQHIRSKFYGQ